MHVKVSVFRDAFSKPGEIRFYDFFCISEALYRWILRTTACEYRSCRPMSEDNEAYSVRNTNPPARQHGVQHGEGQDVAGKNTWRCTEGKC